MIPHYMLYLYKKKLWDDDILDWLGPTMVTLWNPQHGYEMVIKSWNPQRNKIESSITTIQILKEKGGKKI
jgi:hypothetical protein